VTEVVVTEYDVLAEVYEWLLSEAKLPPAEFAASFDDVLSRLPGSQSLAGPGGC
jgi:hypothetical protein